MSIKYNRYFCEMERDMGASWAVCTYNREEDKDYWEKGPPCEYSDDDCPFYLPEEQAYNIIRKEVKKNVKDSGVYPCT